MLGASEYVTGLKPANTTAEREPGRRWAAWPLLTAIALLVALAGVVSWVTLRCALVRGREDRHARYAAAAGLEAAREVLQAHEGNWSNLLSADGRPVILPRLVGSKETGPPFPLPGGATVTVWILNNPDDPGFSAGRHTDGLVIVRSLGEAHCGQKRDRQERIFAGQRE